MGCVYVCDPDLGALTPLLNSLAGDCKGDRYRRIWKGLNRGTSSWNWWTWGRRSSVGQGSQEGACPPKQASTGRPSPEVVVVVMQGGRGRLEEQLPRRPGRHLGGGVAWAVQAELSRGARLEDTFRSRERSGDIYRPGRDELTGQPAGVDEGNRVGVCGGRSAPARA